MRLTLLVLVFSFLAISKPVVSEPAVSAPVMWIYENCVWSTGERSVQSINHVGLAVPDGVGFISGTVPFTDSHFLLVLSTSDEGHLTASGPDIMNSSLVLDGSEVGTIFFKKDRPEAVDGSQPPTSVRIKISWGWEGEASILLADVGTSPFATAAGEIEVGKFSFFDFISPSDGRVRQMNQESTTVEVTPIGSPVNPSGGVVGASQATAGKSLFAEAFSRMTRFIRDNRLFTSSASAFALVDLEILRN